MPDLCLFGLVFQLFELVLFFAFFAFFFSAFFIRPLKTVSQ